MDHVSQQATDWENRLSALEKQCTLQAQFASERLEGIAGHITHFDMRLHGPTAHLGEATAQLDASIGEMTSRVKYVQLSLESPRLRLAEGRMQNQRTHYEAEL